MMALILAVAAAAAMSASSVQPAIAQGGDWRTAVRHF
jgi:hypothetical protein